MANVEQKLGSPSKKIQSSIEAVKVSLTGAVKKTGAYLYLPGMVERTARELFLESGFENVALLSDPLSKGKKLVIVASHQSLGDVGPMLRVAAAVQKAHPEHVKNFSYILSKTIRNGKQGEATKSYSAGQNRLFRRYHARALEVASTRDTQERETLQEFGDTRAVLEAVRKPGEVVMVHIEANMDAGRINRATGEINGMGPMNPNVRKILGHLVGFKPEQKGGRRRAEQIVFLPVGIDGSYKLYDPGTRKIRPEGWSLIHQLEAAIVLYPATDLHPEHIGTIRVEKPFTNEDLEDSPDPLREIELRVAKALPPDARGVFKDALRGVR